MDLSKEPAFFTEFRPEVLEGIIKRHSAVVQKQKDKGEREKHKGHLSLSLIIVLVLPFLFPPKARNLVNKGRNASRSESTHVLT